MSIETIKLYARGNMHEKIAKIQREEKKVSKDLKFLKKKDIKMDRKMNKMKKKKK